MDMDKQIVTREEALEQGLKHYYTGKPCKRGHYAERYTNCSTCVLCSYQKTAEWIKNNPEKSRENSRDSYRKWRENNLEKAREKNRKWQENNLEKARELARKWHKDNPEKSRAQKAKRRAAKLERTPEWADYEKIETIYAQSGTEDHVDHIIPLQGEIVSGLHVHTNLQVIPANENVQKGNRISREELDNLAKEDLKCLRV